MGKRPLGKRVKKTSGKKSRRHPLAVIASKLGVQFIPKKVR